MGLILKNVNYKGHLRILALIGSDAKSIQELSEITNIPVSSATFRS